MDLISAWRDFDATADPPYILDDDRPALKKFLRSRERHVSHISWEKAHSHPDAGNPDKNHIHFGRLPTPFVGDLLRASIYILTLNPGHALGDYYAEYKDPSFRKVLLNNLRQESRDQHQSFIFLDPQFAWDGGFNYWHGKLEGVIGELATYRGVSFAQARSDLSEKLAVIELVPYHSVSSGAVGNLPDKLDSSQLAKEFVKNHVLEKVRNGNAIVIVVRQVRRWDEALGGSLQEGHGVIRYTQGEARGASLSPRTRGGKAILKYFGHPGFA